MIIKTRDEPVELTVWKYLKRRMNFSDSDESYFLNVQRGFIGEQQFDTWLNTITVDCLILNDLLLECNNTIFQVDSLLITVETIYLFEIKNYEGDFFIANDTWYTSAKTEIKDPLLQLKRVIFYFNACC